MADITEVIHRITYEVNDDALIKQYEKIVLLSKELNGMSVSADKSGIAISGLGKSFAKAFSKANWVGLAADAGKVLADFSKESIEAALAAEQIKIAFGNLNNATLLDELRSATKGMVDDVTLMHEAIAANNANLPLEHLATAMEYAQQKAKFTGESVRDLANEILVGLGAQSEVILRNGGVDVEKLNAEFSKTGDYAAAAATVIKGQLQESGNDLISYGDKINILGTLWDNFKVATGEALLNVGNFIGKAYLKGNPILEAMIGISAVEIELQEKERDIHEKRIALRNKYIKQYEEGDAQLRSRLVNNATNMMLKIQNMEDDARNKGLTALANDYNKQLAYLGQFFDATIDKTNIAKNTLQSLYAQRSILESHRNVQKIGGEKYNATTSELNNIQSLIDNALGRVGAATAGKSREAIYNEEQTNIDKEAVVTKNTDDALKRIIQSRIELEERYKELYETDIAEGRNLTAEERKMRDIDYDEQLKIINYREDLRINELDRFVLQKKLKLARVKKNNEDVARIERELLENIELGSRLDKEVASVASDKIDTLSKLQTRVEYRDEFKAKQVELPKLEEQQKGLSEEQKENIKEGIEGYQQLAQAAADAYSKIIQAQIDALDKEISVREKRVEEAKKLAERGNTEALRLEEDRLRKAQEQRAKFARQQQTVNAAITVSNAIAAVARAALEGGGFGSAATIAALIAALAAGYAAVSSMTSDTESFATGVVDYKGKGGPRDDKNWVRISSGESIITAAGTQKNRAILEAINQGAALHMIDPTLPMMMPMLKLPGSRQGNAYAETKDLKRLETKLDEVVGAIENNKLKQNIFFNEQGIGIMTERAIQKDRKRWK